MTTTLAEIRDFVTSSFPGADAVGDTESLVSSGLLDSMGVVEIIQFIEGKYGIAIPDDDIKIENFDSIAAIVEFIAAKKT